MPTLKIAWSCTFTPSYSFMAQDLQQGHLYGYMSKFWDSFLKKSIALSL
jgi:hypothetical protein